MLSPCPPCERDASASEYGGTRLSPWAPWQLRCMFCFPISTCGSRPRPYNMVEDAGTGMEAAPALFALACLAFAAGAGHGHSSTFQLNLSRFFTDRLTVTPPTVSREKCVTLSRKVDEWRRPWLAVYLPTSQLILQVCNSAVTHGGAVQVDPMKPTLQAPGSNCLKLKCDKLLSSFAFNSNLCRYSTACSTHSSAPSSSRCRW